MSNYVSSSMSLWLTILLFVSSCIGASSCICTKEYTPYCCDGKVYGNGCEAKCADFAVDTDCTVGACAASSCICTKEYTPYCCDGKVYGNGCEAKCADFAVDTDCTVGACAEGIPSCICTKEYTPYCCDGKVYGNGCEAKCADFAVDTDCTVGACAADAGLPATTPVATAASQDCLRVRGASVSAINGIYKRDERAGGQWINKKKKKYGKNGKVKIKLYRYKKYWMFGTARNDGESITKCGPAGGGNAVKRCNDWSHEQTLKISSSDCTWSSAMEEDTGDSFTDGVTRNPLVIGGILVALVVACGVFIWFGCKKRKRITKEKVLDHEEDDEEEEAEGEELSELEIVMPHTTN
eukprot:626534_1